MGASQAATSSDSCHCNSHFFKSLCLYSLNRGKDINKCDDDVLVHGKKFKSGEGTSNEFFIYSMFIHAQKLILLNMYGNF